MKETFAESDQICEARGVSASSIDFAYFAIMRLISSPSALVSRPGEAAAVFDSVPAPLIALPGTAEASPMNVSAIDRPSASHRVRVVAGIRTISPPVSPVLSWWFWFLVSILP
jgi:hypothetical protein